MEFFLWLFLYVGVASALAFGLKMIVRGTKHERPKLTQAQREVLEELQMERDSAAGALKACIQNRAGHTAQWDIDYYTKRIEELRYKVANYDSQIETLQNSGRSVVNPPSITSGCGHAQLIEVESGGETVAYICEKCNAQVNIDDPAATRHRVRKQQEADRAARKRRIDEQWRSIWSEPSVRDQLQEEIAIARSELARAASDNGLMDRDVAKHLHNLQAERFDTTYASAAPEQGLEDVIEVYDGGGNVIRRIVQ